VKKKEALRSPPKTVEPAVLNDLATAAGIGEVISVRAAKAQLSALLELVAAGRDVVITRGGQPKVRLVSYAKNQPRAVFKGSLDHLRKMPRYTGGPTGTEIIRAERDGRY
jgi:prevent-host-death family protein